jgi:proteasome-associated ATPase
MQRRSAPSEIPIELVLDRLAALLESGLPLEDKMRHVAAMRASAAPAAEDIDRYLIERVGQLYRGLEGAQLKQGELRELLEKLTAPPFFPAIYHNTVTSGSAPTAMVRFGQETRAVGFGDQVSSADLAPGDEVLLSSERNVIVGKAQGGCFDCGELATFSRFLEDGGRAVVKSREEEFVVILTASLRAAGLKAGDELRCDRNLGIAFEKVERSRGDEFFLQETPKESFAQIGGLDREIEQIKQMFALHCFHGDVVSKYQLKRKRSLLLYGPSGTGKTLLARALANWLAQSSKHKRARFGNIAPGALKSMWYGQTEQKIREVFRVAREASAEDPEIPTVLFVDEIDSLGSMRGESVHRIDDHVLNAFMSELSGLEDRGNVVLVAATNLLSHLDSAMVRGGRLGDLVLKIPRPNRKAARAIFHRHMPETIPYACNGEGPLAARQAIIDSAVSLIFAANEDSELAHVTFRDGKRRPVRAGEMINGAEIAAIAQSAIERACARETRQGEGGVELQDVLTGVGTFLEKSTRVLTPANCRNYLEDLPQDVDVVRVEPVQRKAHNRFQYFHEVA